MRAETHAESEPSGQPVLEHAGGPILARLGRRGARLRSYLLDDTFKIVTGLSETDEERADHLASIQRFTAQPEHWRLHAWMHQNLTILDDKVASTLTLNSIGVATLTFLYSTLGAHTPRVLYIGILISSLIFLWAIVPLARVSFVFWSSTRDFDDPDKLLRELLLIRDKRTAIVRGALVKDAFALAIFMIAGAVTIMQTIVD